MKKILLLLLIILVKAKAQAACGLSMTISNVNIDWDLNFSSVAVQITVAKTNQEACDFGIGMSKGSGSSYSNRIVQATGGKTMSYQLYSDSAFSQTIKDYPNITLSTDVVTGGFGTGVNLTHTAVYYISIPYSLATVPTLAGQGTYTDTFTVNLYEGSDPTAYTTAVASTNVTLTVTVPYMIAMSLVDSGSSFSLGSISKSINFGTLSEGQSQSFDLRVRTNAGFTVTFSSAHNGYMQHTNSAKNSKVPYKLYVNSSLLNMASSSTTPVTGLSASGQTSLNGLGYPVQVVIGSLSSSTVLGGQHSDSITITATTSE